MNILKTAFGDLEYKMVSSTEVKLRGNLTVDNEFYVRARIALVNRRWQLLLSHFGLTYTVHNLNTSHVRFAIQAEIEKAWTVHVTNNPEYMKIVAREKLKVLEAKLVEVTKAIDDLGDAFRAARDAVENI